MNCLYINLETAIERRIEIEANLRDVAPHWDIERIAAITPQEALQFKNPPGYEDYPATRACYFSHLKALKYAKKLQGPVLILEDDAQLNCKAVQTLDSLINNFCLKKWDILFTSATLMSVDNIVSGFSIARRARSKNEINLIDLKNWNYACATSYVVHPNSLDRLIDLLENSNQLIGYDYAIRRLIEVQQIIGLITIPFLSSVSRHSPWSQLNANGIHDQNTDLVLNAVRKLVFIEPDLDQIRQDLYRTEDYFQDPELELLGKIYALINHPQFVGK